MKSQITSTKSQIYPVASRSEWYGTNSNYQNTTCLPAGRQAGIQKSLKH
ncbi:hypothetical protein KJ991_00540 [Patescibacteria group bacterium]|nr:hypothetical protein [Patescibacteria group bacterium]MBU4116015.1 hypothetical protein [Patescibacteria group bacterium]